jgi:hypothetical protein
LRPRLDVRRFNLAMRLLRKSALSEGFKTIW